MNNELSSLPKLPETIEDLSITDNLLPELPELPKRLKILYCYNNAIHNLPDKLPNTLVELYCGGNNITKLPELPNTLITLNVCRNQLKYLPRLPNNLEHLNCHSNNLTDLLPIISNKITEFSYWSNPIFEWIKYYFRDRETYNNFVIKTETIFANKIRNWFLEHKYNPKKQYCKNRLLKEYKDLYSD